MDLESLDTEKIKKRGEKRKGEKKTENQMLKSGAFFSWTPQGCHRRGPFSTITVVDLLSRSSNLLKQWALKA